MSVWIRCKSGCWMLMWTCVCVYADNTKLRIKYIISAKWCTKKNIFEEMRKLIQDEHFDRIEK